MNSKIKSYINEINFMDDKLYFRGDGEWDGEDGAFEADKQVVLNYIDHCKEQIKIAKQYLKTIKDK